MLTATVFFFLVAFSLVGWSWATHCKCNSQFPINKRGKQTDLHRFPTFAFACASQSILLRNQITLFISMTACSNQSSVLKHKSTLGRGPIQSILLHKVLIKFQVPSRPVNEPTHSTARSIPARLSSTRAQARHCTNSLVTVETRSISQQHIPGSLD